MTARDYIKGAMRLGGAIASGETPTADELTDGLAVMNEMFDAWSADGLMIYVVTRETFTVSASQSSRTFGTGGNFNSSRPTQVVGAGVVKDSQEYKVNVLTIQQWKEIQNKSQTASLITDIYPEGTHPLETVNVWPVPTETNSLVLYSLKPFSEVSNVSADMSFPPGYQEAIRYNLWLKWAPEFGRTPSEEVKVTAAKALTNLKAKNLKVPLMKSDAFSLSSDRHTWDYKTGEYR